MRSNSSPRRDPAAAPPSRPRRAATPLTWGRGRARPTSVPGPGPAPSLTCFPESCARRRRPRSRRVVPQSGGTGRPGARRGRPGARERGASPPEAASQPRPACARRRKWSRPRRFRSAARARAAAAAAGGVDGPGRPERPWRRAAAPTGGPGRGPQVTCARPPGPGRVGQRGRGRGGGGVTPAPVPTRARAGFPPPWNPRCNCQPVSRYGFDRTPTVSPGRGPRPGKPPESAPHPITPPGDRDNAAPSALSVTQHVPRRRRQRERLTPTAQSSR